MAGNMIKRSDPMRQCELPTRMVGTVREKCQAADGSTFGTVANISCTFPKSAGLRGKNTALRAGLSEFNGIIFLLS